MKKIYLLIIAFGSLLLYNRTWAQCSVSISTNPNITQLDCNNTSIKLTANAGGSGKITYQWSTGSTAQLINVTQPGTYKVTITDTTNCTTSSSIQITKNITPPTVTILAFPDSICSGSSSTLIGFGADTYAWQPGSLTGTTVSVTPRSTTFYTVTGTAANGCTGTSSFKLVVNPLPNASISTNTTGCQYGAEPGVTFKGSNGNMPYTFAYNIDGGPTQTITTSNNDSLITVGASTGVPGSFTYNLVSVTDGNGCSQSQNIKAVVTVFPAPSFTSSKAESICSNTVFNYTATSSVTGTNFKWTRAAVPGISNGKDSGSTPTINETLHNTTAQPIVVNYVFTLSTGTGCDKTDTVKVTVNPTPVINTIPDYTFCNGTPVNGIAFSSASPNSSFSWTCNPTIGFGSSGSGNIPAFTATNTSTAPIIATVKVSITASSDNCAGTDSTFKITVYPGPVLTSAKVASVCDNAPFLYTATSSANGTNFKWTRAAVTGINNGKDSGSTATINETLHNTTAQPVTVNYVFTLSTGTGCDKIDTVRVTVNPTPVINTIPDYTFCNGDTISGIKFSSTYMDSAFTWTCNPTIGFGSGGSGSIPPFTATNNDTVPVVTRVAVSMTASSNHCRSSDSAIFTITVRPSPIFTSPTSASVCDNALFTYTATSSANNTNFTWARAVVPGISNGNNTGSTATINETLHNTTAQPVVVNYVFKLSTGTGCDRTATVKVTVNPTPVINPIPDYTFCNGDTISGIKFSSTYMDSAFTWTCNPTIGFGSGGSGSIPAFTATNNDTVPVVTRVAVSMTASSNHCRSSDSAIFAITVRPSPIFTSPTIASVCDNAPFIYTATSSAPKTKFTWKRDIVSGIANDSTHADTAFINETLHNTTANPVIVNYVFKLSTGTGCDKTATVKVTVNPTPVINPIPDYTFCNGDTVNGIAFSSTSPDSSFTWTCTPTIGFGSAGSSSIPRFTATTDSMFVVASVKVSIIASSNRCAGSDSSFTIKVYPNPFLTSPKVASVCNNAPFTYTAKSFATGTIFRWTRDAVAGIANNPASDTIALINETLNNTTAQPVVVNYVFKLSTGGLCYKTDTLKVTVNPTPEINSISNYIFCNGAAVNRITFSSASPNSSFTWTCNPTIGFGSGGSDSIPAFTATNTDTIPVVASIKVSITASSDRCAGSDSGFTIKVYPNPFLTSPKVASVCNNKPFTYTAKSYANGTSFEWTRGAVTGIANDSTHADTAFINETLNNTTAQPVVVNYIFKLSTGALCYRTDTVKVTVNPTPVINPIPDYTFCNGAAVNGIAFSSNSPDSSFTWTCNPTIGFGSSGSGSIPAFTATNTDTVADVTTVNVKLMASSDHCVGSDSSFTITVYPNPFLTSPKVASVCDTSLFKYTAKSFANGTSFTWARDPVAGIANAPSGDSTKFINETLHNTTSQPVAVNYIFKLSTGALCYKTDTVNLTVNPKPVINQIPDYTFCNGDAVNGIAFSSASPNSSFTWTSDTTVGFGLDGSGSIPAFTATNTDTVADVTTVNVKLMASSDHCVGSDSSFTITVKPSPLKPGFTSFSSYPDNQILVLCNSSENINFSLNSPASPGSGVSYNWTSKPGSPNVVIKDSHHPNTVVSFNNTGIDTIKVVASNATTGCINSATQLVQITNKSNDVNKLKIFKKQPGNLLIYPDNTITGYQWGYDSLIQASPDTAFGSPVTVQGQVYQTFIPDSRFIVNGSLDESRFFYWVLLHNNGCDTKVYYNGPYDDKQDSVRRPNQDGTIQLQVMPNPNTGIFEIGLKGNIYGTIDAKIYNALGQLVFRKTFIKTIPDVYENFTTNNLPGGVYFLILNSSDLKQVSARFLISH